MVKVDIGEGTIGGVVVGRGIAAEADKWSDQQLFAKEPAKQVAPPIIPTIDKSVSSKIVQARQLEGHESAIEIARQLQGQPGYDAELASQIITRAQAAQNRKS